MQLAIIIEAGGVGGGLIGVLVGSFSLRVAKIVNGMRARRISYSESVHGKPELCAA